jgi:hypothetical protein
MVYYITISFRGIRKKKKEERRGKGINLFEVGQ